jgi:glycosyltransferase involved in cell wall biosynthesis
MGAETGLRPWPRRRPRPGATIGVLVTDDGRGLWGAQQHLLRIAPYYEEAGFMPTLATLRDSELAQAWSDSGRVVIGLRSLPSLPETVGPLQAPQVAIHSVRVLTRAQAVAAEARRLGAGLLVANSTWTHLDVAVAGRLARLPSVLMLHEEVPKTRLRRLAVQSATWSIAVSHSVAHEVGPRAQKRIAVIRNGVDTSAFTPGPARPDVRMQLAADPGSPIVGYVGRLDPMKQVDHIVRAIGELNRSGHGPVQLAVVGTTSVGPAYERELRQLAQRELGDNVRFLGRRTDIVAILRSLDAIAITGRWEGLSLSLLEALAAGCPVVAYPAAGVTEVIQDGVSGLVAPMADWSGLGRLLGRVVASPEVREGLRHAGRARVEGHFSLVGQAAETVQLLRDAVNA